MTASTPALSVATALAADCKALMREIAAQVSLLRRPSELVGAAPTIAVGEPTFTSPRKGVFETTGPTLMLAAEPGTAPQRVSLNLHDRYRAVCQGKK
jgi:hypothetical protein